MHIPRKLEDDTKLLDEMKQAATEKISEVFPEGVKYSPELDRMIIRAEKLLDNECDLIEKLKEIRIAKGLTQTEVAMRMGTYHPNVNRWEKRGGNLTLSTLRRWCLALGVVLEFNLIDEEVSNE